MLLRSLHRPLLCLLLTCGLATSVALSGEVNLRWDSSAGAAGYRLYHGSASGSYDGWEEVNSSPFTAYTEMPDCALTYFAVTAYNAEGESGYSTEVASWPRPAVTGSSDTSGQRGEQLSLVLSGSNFHPSATLSFSNPAIVVNSLAIDSCGQISADIAIGGSAAFGPTEIHVTNPLGVTGTAAGLFSVDSGPPLPQVEGLRRTDTINSP